ncbi:hypothetical protein P43SY_001204 [Pythium insidiosum]|uniref:Sodium-dependent phosphate transporter n=1 Tax=Pythium insidiosum TaxID=114742 RepID=A0AAD5M5F0_PYTIN|nr:hypothetical protein P43SY_001204 [Pythium insidiosum]
MAAATVHDMFNIWSVAVMFPLEVVFHPLERLSRALANARIHRGNFTSPIDAVVDPFTDILLDIDKNRVYEVASGRKLCEHGHTFIKSGALGRVHLRDGSIGVITVAIGLVTLICSLVTLVRMLAKVFLGPTKRLLNHALQYNAYVNILAGTIVTFAVHSSTVVTSTLTPMAGLGVITLEQAHAIILGSNLGTTATALLASLVTGRSDAVAMALVHFFFNLLGIAIFYPLPFFRHLVLRSSTALAHCSALWPLSAVIFLVMLFLFVPAISLGLVYMCTASDGTTVALGYVLSVLVGMNCAVFLLWYKFGEGRRLWHTLLERKRMERELRKYGGNIGMPTFVDPEPEPSEYEL